LLETNLGQFGAAPYRCRGGDGFAARERAAQDAHRLAKVALAQLVIVTSNAFAGRFVTDWAGPNSFISSVKIRLGAPNYPGDTMTVTGSVTAKDDATRTVTVAVKGSNSMGDHMNATVEVVLP
jgi:VCBS repeat-containing protein